MILVDNGEGGRGGADNRVKRIGLDQWTIAQTPLLSLMIVWPTNSSYIIHDAPVADTEYTSMHILKLQSKTPTSIRDRIVLKILTSSPTLHPTRKISTNSYT